MTTLLEHNEMIIHGTPPHLFKNTTTPGVTVYVQVRCAGKDGNPCGHLLARVNVERWEQDMASKAELQCKCGKKYSLSEYR
jgi:hypothetical protein